ncbi:hypothetical protein DITRI_Ditri05aG0034800 [Diplodiscus trichospermus]
MASISKICSYKSFPLSFPWSRKDQALHQRFSFPVTCASSEQILFENKCLVFAQMPERVGVSTYYRETKERENGDLARNLLDNRHLISVLKFCAAEGWLELGRSYHALIAKIGLDADGFIGTSLIDMYAKCGDMDSAEVVFNQIRRLDVASCNCLISGYASCGLFHEAFRLFMKYDTFGSKPNPYTYSAMLAISGSLSAIGEGKQLHAQVLKMQYLSETPVSNALLTMYRKCGAMDDAEALFKHLPRRNIISWTAIINGLYQHQDFEKAMMLFCLMRESGIEPNEYTFTIVLASCGSMRNLDHSRSLHALVVKKGMALSEFVGTAIIDMYSELGEMDDAKKQFKGMGALASKVSRNALTKGVVQNEKANEALDAFGEMVRKDSACDEFTFSIILKACASLPSFTSCQQIHARIVKANFDTNLQVGSSLIEAYAKCGSVEDAEQVFCQISAPDVVSWNSMIKAYSQNGNPGRAISLFRRMIDKGFRPTPSTFLAVLSACSHSGKIQEGQEIFQSMVSGFGISPEEAHYSCMVDLLGRSGQLEKALDCIKSLPIKPTASIWRPLLAACRCHNNLQMAEFVAKHILAMDPNDATVYVTLSNMYAEAGQLVNAENQRKLMKLKDVRKEPGCSWIEVNNKIHKFFAWDRTHPESAKIYNKLLQLIMQIKGTAYATKANSLQLKEDSCIYHSEKLAVCFALISLPAGKPVRIFKNLRVCNDCHMFMKDESITIASLPALLQFIQVEMLLSRSKSSHLSDQILPACDGPAYCQRACFQSGYYEEAIIFLSEMRSRSSLGDMYTKCKQVGNARKVFDSMFEKDLVALNAFVSVYAQKGTVEEGFCLVEEMVRVKPDVFTWNTLIAGV